MESLPAHVAHSPRCGCAGRSRPKTWKRREATVRKTNSEGPSGSDMEAGSHSILWALDHSPPTRRHRLFLAALLRLSGHISAGSGWRPPDRPSAYRSRSSRRCSQGPCFWPCSGVETADRASRTSPRSLGSAASQPSGLMQSTRGERRRRRRGPVDARRRQPGRSPPGSPGRMVVTSPLSTRNR